MTIVELSELFHSLKILSLRGENRYQRSPAWKKSFVSWRKKNNLLWISFVKEYSCEDELWYFLFHPTENKSDFKCAVCGKQLSFSEWFRHDNRSKKYYCSSKCRLEISKKSFFEKTGLINPGQLRKSPEKVYYETHLSEFKCKKCGVQLSFNKSIKKHEEYCDKCKNIMKTDSLREEYNKNPRQCEVCGSFIPFEKRKCKTCSKKCGFKLTHINSKSTMLERYGVEHAFKSKEIYNKMKKTCLERFGTENPTSTLEIRNKIKNTNLKKWGCENPRQNKEIQRRTKETCLKKYGVLCPLNVNQEKKIEKSIETKLDKYGSLAINCHRFVYDNLRFDSKDELYFFIYNKEILKNDIKRGPTFEFEFQNKIHRYECDFKIGEKLYEIKSSHLFKNGKLYFPYEEDKIFRQALWDKKTEVMEQNNVKVILTNSDEMKKIIEEVNKVFTKDFVELFDVHAEFPYPNEKLIDKSDLGLIHHFHKSIYSAYRKGKMSPVEAWKDKNLVKEIALNRLKYVGHCSPKDIIQGFNVTLKAPKVSTFLPSIAEELISKYLNNYETIVDPFSGFSGRLLAAENYHKKYFGFDINEDHVKESNEIIAFRNFEKSNIEVRDILSDFERETYDCLFTCPPYGGKEHWNEKNDEVEKSCDEWIDICLKKFNCKKYLFIIDETEKYKNYIVETLVKKSHFGERKEFVILIGE